MALGLAIFSRSVFAQPSPDLSGPGELKKLSVEQLMDIEVTSVSLHPEKLSEAASAVQVITGDDIRRSGATSLPEALRLASNLDVAQIDSRQWAISARGFNNTTSNKLLVLMDGRTIYTPLYAGVFWDVQDTLLEDLDQIEVISGPGATQWGDNAVNGVINITTKPAKDTQGLLVTGGGGTAVKDFEGVRYGGALAPALHYRIYGKYFDRDSTEFSNLKDGGNDWHMGQGGFRMDWDASASDLLTLQGDVYSGRVAQLGAGDTTLHGDNIIGRWARTFSEKSDLKLQMYYDRTYRSVPGTFSEGLDTYDVDFQHRFPMGERHDITWGLGYRLIKDNVGNTPVLAFLPANVSHRQFNVFGQDEIALVQDQVYLTLGTKIDHNDYTGVEYQPSVRLAWKLSPEQTMWGAISRAVRTPSRIDRDFYVPPTPPFLLSGGPNFDSEKLTAYELGYRVRPDEQLSFSLATFYNYYDDVRSLEKTQPPAPFPVVIGNGLKTETYGAELSADYRATEWWRLRAGYTQIHLHFWPKAGSTDTSGGSTESHDPEDQFTLQSSLDLPGHWAVDTDFRYVASIANQSVPAYHEMDVRLGWQPFSQLELSVVGQNLLHNHHAEFGAATTRQEIERSVYGKAVWSY
ncbi:MAG TPA: TonB-dependent receptor [Opitutaceae bacterium]|nr:TonB-dependent receptor [Opitutaceae bacterium]